MREKNGVTVSDILFFVMTFVFFALNTYVIKIPMAALLRWILPALIVVCSRKRASQLPSLVMYFIIAVLPSL